MLKYFFVSVETPNRDEGFSTEDLITSPRLFIAFCWRMERDCVLKNLATKVLVPILKAKPKLYHGLILHKIV